MTVTADLEPAPAVLSDAHVGEPLAELVQLWRHVDALTNLPDASTLSGERALELAALIAKVRHASDALLAPYAARVEELSDASRPVRLARWKGFPNAASLLSSVTGLSVGESGKLIGLGRALADAGEAVPEPPVLGLSGSEVPEVGGLEQSVLAGEGKPAASQVPLSVMPPVMRPATPLEIPPVVPRIAQPLAAAIKASTIGTEKANLIRRTLDDMTSCVAEAEAALVALAPKLSIVQLRRLCLETFAQYDPRGYAAREARQRRDRFFKMSEEPDGMISFYGKLDPASAAAIKAWFEAEMQAAVFAQRDIHPSEQRKLGQILADVLVTTVRHASGCTLATSRPKSTFIIRATRESLASGEGMARCDGVEAPLTIGTALAMAVDAEFAALLTGEDGVPTNLGRAKRSASRAQRLIAMERDKGCAKCCQALSRCDAHHIVGWAAGGNTDQDNLVMLCVACHHQLHDFGWGIVVEDGAVWFIPPASHDPRRRRIPGSSARLAA